jgi:pyridoxamine 5'-phosphate oxidase-like protein
LNAGVHEEPADVAALQELLDRSMASAGPHLRSIIREERRVGAAELCARLTGMRLLVLATVTADGRPMAGPVDGVFFRGAFHFGTGADAVRLAHIRLRPDVSASHLPDERFAVTVHGRAVPLDLGDPANAGFRSCLLDVYVPQYGPDFEGFLDSGPVYCRIEARRMFSFQMVP